MKNRTIWMATVVVAVMLIGGCSPGSRYEKQLKKELASGLRYDSLFMGIHFGMSDKDFYTLCWELNREGIIRQSNSNTSVEYHPGEKLKHPATVEFYPKFLNEKIVEMPVKFYYDGWAPWNKELSSGKLVEDIRAWYEDEYGKGFITVIHPARGKAFTKIDGNRRITIYQEDDLYAWAIFTDMSAESEEQANEKQAE
ncbi:MAG: hypothetical protein E4H10_04295 [Bacteroidia bacterium]|nr:MAG: hypothetical protein E4H10_04295 [Bacteroidia bacterium]